ncbi:RpnC/YadD family protein [Sphingobacterium siyangense]|uniref:hypothetical protein n=1 Tax=Sphingobacterium siyangense TaxID=459529 RepID=UPI0019655B4F|nr:hypothetical protein [Sphingobacterium siyangense]QRY58310.1 hypothetical protein JVX97_02200 [Sphingobacterium siyangense]
MRKFWVYFLNRLVLNGRGEIDKLLFVGNLSKFEKEIETKIGRSDTMGTQEYLLDKAEKKGIQKGIQKGKIEGKREEAIAIALEFKKMGLPIADIAKGTGLSIEEIEKL